MAAGTFIKDNLALVAGVAVPVVLVVGFLLAGILGKMLTPPPAYTAYFVVQNYDYTNTRKASTDIKVDDDGKIIVTVTPVKKDENDYRPNASRDILVSYDPIAGTLDEQRIVTPRNMTKGSFTPDTLKDLRLSPKAQAADGYNITYGRRGDYSLVADIFIARRADSYRISKNSAVYRLPDRAVGANVNSRYDSLRFLGWSTEKTR